MPESPEWLTAYKRYHEAEINLHKMARWNGYKNTKVILQRKDHAESEIKMKVPVETLVLDGKLRLHVLISSILWDG